MKIGILDGYKTPKHKRRKHRRSKRRLHGISPAMKRQQGKMKACALKWKRSGKHGKYTSFLSRCLKGS